MNTPLKSISYTIETIYPVTFFSSAIPKQFDCTFTLVFLLK